MWKQQQQNANRIKNEEAYFVTKDESSLITTNNMNTCIWIFKNSVLPTEKKNGFAQTKTYFEKHIVTGSELIDILTCFRCKALKETRKMDFFFKARVGEINCKNHEHKHGSINSGRLLCDYTDAFWTHFKSTRSAVQCRLIGFLRLWLWYQKENLQFLHPVFFFFFFVFPWDWIGDENVPTMNIKIFNFHIQHHRWHTTVFGNCFHLWFSICSSKKKIKEKWME